MVSQSDVQRLFLQALISRRVISVNLAQTLWAKCIDAVRGDLGRNFLTNSAHPASILAADDSIEIHHSKQRDAWEQFVVKINDSLDCLDLEFRHLHDEYTGQEVYALVNRRGDEIAQMATQYSPAEIAYFRALVEQIMLAPNESYCVSSMAALHKVNSLKTSMSKTQAEAVLGTFVANGWLLKSKQGRYTLSTRSLIELLHYLQSTYPDEIIECTACLEMITRGVACHTNNCKARMHFHCFNTYRKGKNACPVCQTKWPEEATDDPLIPVGEGAARKSDDLRPTRRQRGEEESDEEEELFDEDSQPSQEQSQSQASRSQPSRSQKSTKGKGKVKTEKSAEVDDNEDEDEEDEDEDEAPRKPRNKRKLRK
ncbi:hypothetical protein ONZ45_g16353 [Pleurotus djamor]|nr:hypothetical protein ONZ45_g16353 [Pleurotus djamor]